MNFCFGETKISKQTNKHQKIKIMKVIISENFFIK